MDVDIAVLGGGPGGYTAAIRAAQLGARVACIDRAPELGGTCLRIGCIPTKAWAQTALALKQAGETFGKLGGSHLDFPAANAWKTSVVKRMTAGVAYLFKANGVTWVNGTGTFTDPNTLAVRGGQDVTFTSAIIATGATVETIADAMAPHPTLSEAIRGAALVALGRAIDVPNRKPARGISVAAAT
jgi:dihydrolipoamide dehydrogenase